MLRVDSRWVRFFHLIYIVYWTINEITPGYDRESIKYIFMFIPIAVAALILWRDGAKVRPDTVRLGQLLIYLAFAVGITFAAAFINEYWTLDLRDVGRNLFPLAYAFAIVNIDHTENKDFYVDTILVACVVVVMGMFWRDLTPANILSINFFDSYSPFEHHLAHEFAFLFCYYYMRKRRAFMVVSIIFSLLTFKRIHIMFVVLVLLFGWLVRNVRVTDFKINLMKAVFCLTPIMMGILTSPGFVIWFDNTFETTFYMFTMGRLAQMTEILSYEGSLLGLQSVEQYLLRINYGTIFHSDLLRVSAETTFVGLFLYVNGYFNMLKARRNIYAYLAMTLMFVTMFASVNLQRLHTYLLLYFICCIDFEAAAKETTLFDRVVRKQRASPAEDRSAGEARSNKSAVT